MLEVASESTANVDTGVKRDDYAALGIAEYWRFDETGEHHGARLTGDRLVEGTLRAHFHSRVPRRQPAGLQCTALDLNLRWENGQLLWHDPATGRPILTYEDQRDRADNEHAIRGTARERNPPRLRDPGTGRGNRCQHSRPIARRSGTLLSGR